MPDICFYMNKPGQRTYFVKQLLSWNSTENERQMPWKGEKDPYKIWLSEIILQQTRVDQGLAYYQRFISTFPTISQLAAAPENQVFKLWEGLGYYTRCKNLLLTARHITNELGGIFPNRYEDILALKGIGPYTAAAIGSFAFNIPAAVVDGNVYRVLSRFFEIDTPTDSVAGKKLFNQLAQDLLDQNNPAGYNQALMDFGATVCKPKLPHCSSCPMKSKCGAFLSGRVSQLPVKEKAIVKTTRWFYYILLDYNGNYFVRKRGPKDIWENLYELILIEKDSPATLELLATENPVKKLLDKRSPADIQLSNVYRQQLTHQTIVGQFFRIKIKHKPVLPGYEMVDAATFDGLPFPKFITNFLKDKSVSLNLF